MAKKIGLSIRQIRQFFPLQYFPVYGTVYHPNRAVRYFIIDICYSRAYPSLPYVIYICYYICYICYICILHMLFLPYVIPICYSLLFPYVIPYITYVISTICYSRAYHMLFTYVILGYSIDYIYTYPGLRTEHFQRNCPCCTNSVTPFLCIGRCRLWL